MGAGPARCILGGEVGFLGFFLNFFQERLFHSVTQYELYLGKKKKKKRKNEQKN